MLFAVTPLCLFFWLCNDADRIKLQNTGDINTAPLNAIKIIRLQARGLTLVRTGCSLEIPAFCVIGICQGGTYTTSRCLTYQDVSVFAEATARMGLDDLFDGGSRVKCFGCHDRAGSGSWKSSKV